jgi:hypothetical protein
VCVECVCVRVCVECVRVSVLSVCVSVADNDVLSIHLRLSSSDRLS